MTPDIFTDPRAAAWWLIRNARHFEGTASVSFSDPDTGWDVLESLGLPIMGFTVKIGQVTVELREPEAGDVLVVTDDPDAIPDGALGALLMPIFTAPGLVRRNAGAA